MAVVRLPHAEALAGVQHHRHLLLIRGVLRRESTREDADETSAVAAETVVQIGLHLALAETGRGFVIHRREELLRREVVGVVLAVEVNLLEGVSVAGRLGSGAARHAREHVRRHVVQGTALEAAVAIEHHQRLVHDALRNVAVRREGDRVLHEVVACAQHELEHGIRAFAVGEALPPVEQRIRKIPEAAWIELALVHERRIDERARPAVRDLHIFRRGSRRTFHLRDGAIRQGEGPARHAPRKAEVVRRGKLLVVEVREDLRGIVLRRDRLREIPDVAPFDGQLMVDAVLLRKKRAGDETASAAGNPVKGTVEGEQRTRVGIDAERVGWLEFARIATHGGDPQPIDRPHEEGRVLGFAVGDAAQHVV